MVRSNKTILIILSCKSWSHIEILWQYTRLELSQGPTEEGDVYWFVREQDSLDNRNYSHPTKSITIASDDDHCCVQLITAGVI